MFDSTYTLIADTGKFESFHNSSTSHDGSGKNPPDPSGDGSGTNPPGPSGDGSGRNPPGPDHGCDPHGPPPCDPHGPDPDGPNCPCVPISHKVAMVEPLETKVNPELASSEALVAEASLRFLDEMRQSSSPSTALKPAAFDGPGPIHGDDPNGGKGPIHGPDPNGEQHCPPAGSPPGPRPPFCQ